LPEVLRKYESAFDLHLPFEIEYRLRRHDGEYRWILDIGVPRFGLDGTFAGYIGSAIDITERKLAEQVLTSARTRLIEAQEQERRRIARDLHDDINQRLALLANELDLLTIDSVESPERPRIKQLGDQVKEISDDIQLISHKLHSSALQHLGLSSALRGLSKDFSRQHKIKLHSRICDLAQPLNEDSALALFRVAQEGLQNASKHSESTNVHIELKAENDVVFLNLIDDGQGFEIDQCKEGLGLVSLRERMKMVGGNFQILSRPGIGTHLQATIAIKIINPSYIIQSMQM
jgi:signal transduction histidine kinase